MKTPILKCYRCGCVIKDKDPQAITPDGKTYHHDKDGRCDERSCYAMNCKDRNLYFFSCTVVNEKKLGYQA